MRTPINEILVLGLGNDILTDDAIGLNVVRQLRTDLADCEGVEVEETMEMGLALLDFMVGYREVIIVDSIQTGKVAPGTIQQVNVNDLACQTQRTPHFLGVGETLALGRLLGLQMPEQVTIFGVEVEDPFTLGTEMTTTLQGALSSVVAAVSDAVQSRLKRLRPEHSEVGVRSSRELAATVCP